MTDKDPAAIIAAFDDAVNMTPSALKMWLDTDDSRSVGMLPGGGRKDAATRGESVGHHMGHRILEIRATKRADLTDTDVADMAKVAGYVHRHMAQKPAKEEIATSRWRKSLMNWGHDPLK